MWTFPEKSQQHWSGRVPSSDFGLITLIHVRCKRNAVAWSPASDRSWITGKGESGVASIMGETN
jgi:hypothetical protein